MNRQGSLILRPSHHDTDRHREGGMLRWSRSPALRRRNALASDVLEGDPGMALQGFSAGQQRLSRSLDGLRECFDAEVAVLYIQVCFACYIYHTRI